MNPEMQAGRLQLGFTNNTFQSLTSKA